VSEEDLVKAVRWKLGIPVDADTRAASEAWARLSRDEHYPDQASRISRALFGLLEPVIRSRLDLLAHQPTKKKDAEFYDAVWKLFIAWVREDEARLSPVISRKILEGLGKSPPTAPPRPMAPPVVVPPFRAQPDPVRATAAPALVAAGPTRPADPEVRFIEGAPPVANSPGPDDRPSPGPPPAEPTPLWKYIPVPEGPDKHVEAWSEAAEAPGGWKLLGARVRGKKHKHEGTNGDDWFEFRVAGPWSIIAVADGAGSRKFSRVGARESCLAAVRSLEGSLGSYRIRPVGGREGATPEGGSADPPVAGEDIAALRDGLIRAVQAAYQAVESAVSARAGRAADYEPVLGRPMEINDLAATLLLAIHALVEVDGAEQSLVLACQVGDGMTGAITHDGGLRLLGEADSGEYSGETDFLTSRGKLTEENLARKTFVALGRIRAVMVMTDGVADDYFPNDPGLLRLFVDLTLNGVVGAPDPGDGAIARALSDTNLPTPEDLAAAPIAVEAEKPTPDGPHRGPIRPAARFAEALGRTIPQVVGSPELLAAGARLADDLPGSPHDRLREWLDLYQVRGSFDDRTLVVLHREEGP